MSHDAMAVGPDLLDPDRAAAMLRPVPRRRRRTRLVTVLAVLGFVAAAVMTTVGIRGLERVPAAAEQSQVPTPGGWTRFVVSGTTFAVVIRPSAPSGTPGEGSASFAYLEKDLTWREAGGMALPSTSDPAAQLGAGSALTSPGFSFAVFPAGSTSISPVFSGDAGAQIAQTGQVTVPGENQHSYVAVAVMTTPPEDIERLRGFTWVDQHGQTRVYPPPR